jgi:LmbE family N-acetylglucosaminyl deacetylase
VSDVMATEVLTDVPDRVLAVYAHPDDPEMSCGGALARWAEAGADVRLVIVNAGDKGSPNPETDPAELTRRRAAEVDAAAAVLGLAGVERLGLPDGEVTNDVELRSRLVGLVRAHRPDIVVAPDPTAVFFGDSYVNHRDHREVGWAALDAIAPAAASPLYFPATGAPHQVRIMLLSGTLMPDVGVDISTVVDKKVKAVQCHESRVGGDPGLVGRLIRARTAEAGAPLGVGHAEAFRRLRFG